MQRLIFRPAEGAPQELEPARLAACLAQPGGLVWLDLAGEPEAQARALLEAHFDFHPLAIDDALSERHVPRVDDWEDYLYLVAHAVAADPEPQDGGIETRELDVFLGRGYLVTHHEQPIALVDEVWAASQRDPRWLRHGTPRLLYHLLDALAEGYLVGLEALALRLEGLEDAIFADSAPRDLERILDVKRALLTLRRVLAPQREVLNKLARHDFAVVATDDLVYFRDVYDHLARAYEMNESLRDLAGSVIETYLSLVNNRMNDVMKTLTVITTLFMPIGFLAGFFGMNFFAPPATTMAGMGAPSRTFVLALMLLTPLIMVWWMRRRRLI